MRIYVLFFLKLFCLTSLSLHFEIGPSALILYFRLQGFFNRPLCDWTINDHLFATWMVYVNLEFIFWYIWMLGSGEDTFDFKWYGNFDAEIVECLGSSGNI